MTTVFIVRAQGARDVLCGRPGRAIGAFTTQERATAFLDANPCRMGDLTVEVASLDFELDPYPEPPLLWSVRVGRDGGLVDLRRLLPEDYRPSEVGLIARDDPNGPRWFHVVAADGAAAIELAQAQRAAAIFADEWPEPEPSPA